MTKSVKIPPSSYPGHSTPVIPWDALTALGKVCRKDARRWMIDLRREADVRLYSDHGQVFYTEEDAERTLNVIRGRVARGEPLARIVDSYLPDDTKRFRVERYVKDWLRIKEHQSADGGVGVEYVRNLRSYAKSDGHFSFWYTKTLHEVTFKTVQEWRFWLREERKLTNARYIRSVMGHFHAFLSWLRDCGEIETIPRFDYPKIAKYKPRILTMDTQAQILAAIPEEARGVFLVCALAVRPNEARALEVRDYEDGWLTIRQAYRGPNVGSEISEGDKRGDFKRIPLVDREGNKLEAALWIERHVLPHRLGRAPMFLNPSRGTRWSARALRAWWGRACDEVGVPRGRFYEDTKHTFGTDLARKKVPERLQQAWMGHSSVTSTRRYAQLADEALLDVLTLARPQPLTDPIKSRNQKEK